MRIIGLIANKNDGPGYHRVMAPLLMMRGVDAHITNVLTEDKLKDGCDVLVINRRFPYNTIPEILTWREKYGFTLVVDIDDYWHLPESHPAYGSWKKYNIPKQITDSLLFADIVTTTHDRLKDKCLQYNDNVYVLPNAIPQSGQFMVQKEPCEKVRIFWQGSPTHVHDIKMLEQPLRKLYKRPETKDKIKQVLAGYQESVEWMQIADSFTGKQTYPYECYTGVHTDRYYHAYQHADICVIPLEDNEFNSHKSNLKVLEAANLGLPVVVSKVHPYLDLPPVLYAENQREWYAHLKELIIDPEYRQIRGGWLKQYCDEHFNFESINKKRKNIYESIKQRVPGAELPSLADS